ncbi:pantoate--beta-alanine ligase [Sporichthya polymorpha]|uniref:pantoate--beta-alanine ligase n=1 Tax=Sporichthya polymorpha TaxID=35751 RepID=UPI0003812A4C|nr:pantoate--beta-alanine ligase [Sporichthya polymorpha]
MTSTALLDPARPTTTTPVVARTRAELNAALAELELTRPGPRGVVMTMGALHDGHAELMRTARRECASVVATIFVNPLQFGANEDLDKYPRTFEADLALCAEAGVDVLFHPGEAEMYPHGRPATVVTAGPLGDDLEGASRPGHFDGVLTVVLKLLHLTGPQIAYFGEKDYQQLTLIRQMVTDLDLDVRIAPVPTVREADGLARSSRNRYLSDAERAGALAISRALRAGAAAGPDGPDAVLAAAKATLAAEPGLVVDYVALRDPELAPAPDTGETRLLVAAKAGTTRLIDNLPVLLGPTVQTARN